MRQRAVAPGAAPGPALAHGGEGLPRVFLPLLGRHQGGHRPGAAQRHPSRRGLSDHPGGLRLLRARLLAGIRHRGRRRARQRTSGSGAARGGRRAVVARPPCRCAGTTRRRPGRRERALLLALHLGLHRPPQGHGPSPPGHGGHERAVRARRALRERGRSHLLRRQALLRLRPRQRDDLSPLGRGHLGAARRASDGAEHARDDRALPANAVLRSPHSLRLPVAGTRNRAPRSLVPASVRVGR